MWTLGDKAVRLTPAALCLCHDNCRATAANHPEVRVSAENIIAQVLDLLLCHLVLPAALVPNRFEDKQFFHHQNEMHAFFVCTFCGNLAKVCRRCTPFYVGLNIRQLWIFGTCLHPGQHRPDNKQLAVVNRFDHKYFDCNFSRRAVCVTSKDCAVTFSMGL